MDVHETVALAAPSEPRTAPRSPDAAGQAQHCSSSQSPPVSAANAGHEGSIVVQRVKDMKADEGFNAQTEQYENLVEAG